MKWLADVIVLLAHTDLRISEAAGLRWTDVDFTADVLRVVDERSSHRKGKLGTIRTTKGRRSRVIPMHSRLRDLLAELPWRADGSVLHAARGGTLLPRNVLTQFTRGKTN